MQNVECRVQNGKHLVLARGCYQSPFQGGGEEIRRPERLRRSIGKLPRFWVRHGFSPTLALLVSDASASAEPENSRRFIDAARVRDRGSGGVHGTS